MNWWFLYPRNLIAWNYKNNVLSKSCERNPIFQSKTMGDSLLFMFSHNIEKKFYQTSEIDTSILRRKASFTNVYKNMLSKTTRHTRNRSVQEINWIQLNKISYENHSLFISKNFSFHIFMFCSTKNAYYISLKWVVDNMEVMLNH